MRIGLNLLYLIPGVVHGTATYALSLVNALATMDSENEYYVFVNQESRDIELPDVPNFHRIVCRFQAARRPIRYFWEQVILPWQLHYYGIDLVHSLGYVGPLMSFCPRVVTIPDLNYVALQDAMPAAKRRILRFFSSQSAQVSTHVITISRFSKSELVRVLNLPPDKITVTYLGPGWSCGSDILGSWESVEQCYELSYPYIVSFGRAGAHKNVPRLITAFNKACIHLPHHLVLIGHLAPRIKRCIDELDPSRREQVTVLGYIPSQHIAPILAHADLFVLPSLYEGFGMPILEAQSAGVAIACSNAASLPEIAGDGAIFFDPLSVDDMVEVIRQCLTDTNLRLNLCQLGKKNVKRFSWEKAARETIAVYKRVYSKTKAAPGS